MHVQIVGSMCDVVMYNNANIVRREWVEILTDPLCYKTHGNTYEHTTIVYHVPFLYRGDSFRREFANLGEISSLLPDVHIMALTATASTLTRKAICRCVGMKKVLLVSQSPNKPNIFYSVKSDQNSIEEAFTSLVSEIQKKRKLRLAWGLTAPTFVV